MESADFLSFVVTRFPSTRPHGISRTSFLVYSRNLRTWATSIFLDFSALSHLIHPIRLIIAFLFVEPRFRYPFLSPLPHDSQAWESLLGSPVVGAHGGLTPQMHDMPVVLQKKQRQIRCFFGDKGLLSQPPLFYAIRLLITFATSPNISSTLNPI